MTHADLAEARQRLQRHAEAAAVASHEPVGREREAFDEQFSLRTISMAFMALR